MSQKTIVLNKDLAIFTVDYLNHFIRQQAAQYSKSLYQNNPEHFTTLLEYAIKARDEINTELQGRIKSNLLKRLYCYAVLGQRLDYGASISTNTAKVISFLTGLFIDYLKKKIIQKRYLEGENENFVSNILCHTINLNGFLNSQIKLNEKSSVRI